MIANLFVGILDLWIMPIFFLISGVGSWYAINSKSNGKYLLERSKRILVPLYTVGLFLILPPQFYFEILTNYEYRGSFLDMLPRYFGGLEHISLSWPGGLLPYPFSGHLWFLLYLFLISLAALPLLNCLRSESGLRFIAILAKWSHRWGGIFIFLVPLLITRIAFTHFFTGTDHTWAHFFNYVVFFLIGYLIAADERFTVGIKKIGWTCLFFGIAGFLAEGYFIFVMKYNYSNIHHPGGESFSMMYVIFNLIMSIASLSWVVFILSLGMKYLNFKSKILNYANEAVLPFYLFHQTIILIVGWFVIGWNIGILPKYTIIAVISFVTIMLLYELLVRRFNVVRFFFGMRPKRFSPARSIAHHEETVA